MVSLCFSTRKTRFWVVLICGLPFVMLSFPVATTSLVFSQPHVSILPYLLLINSGESTSGIFLEALDILFSFSWIKPKIKRREKRKEKQQKFSSSVVNARLVKLSNCSLPHRRSNDDPPYYDWNLPYYHLHFVQKTIFMLRPFVLILKPYTKFRITVNFQTYLFIFL